MLKPVYKDASTRDTLYLRLLSLPLIFVFVLFLVFSGLGNIPLVHATPAISASPHTTTRSLESNGLAQKPLLGWSSWSSIRNNPTEANIEAQAQAMSTTLKSHGYQYINMDDFWYQNPATTVDQYGRWATDTNRFPHGIASVATYIHNLGLKFGIYLTPGIPVAAVKQNTPIEGTSYHAADIADTSRYETNYNFGSGSMYYINYSKPGAQAFVNSWANQFASWGVDFLKIDGVGDGDIPDIQAWSTALKQSGRPIYFHLSNSLDINNVSTWQQNANGWRIDGDVECYCSSLVTWNSFSSRFNDAAAWSSDAGPGGWNDMDSLDVGNGSKDGITQDERQTYMTLWSIESAPLYTGDDLTQLDSYGTQLLTNDEVIAVDQAGHPAHPVSQSSSQQVWYANNGDGSYTVALFNLGGSTATVTANWSDLGFSGAASVHDLWSHTDLGSVSGSFGASLNAHASRLLKVTPSATGQSYEAESSANTLAGGASISSCAVCSGGQRVGYVGNGGTLQFNNVNVSSAGTYSLIIAYLDGDAGRSAQMSVNGASATTLNFHGTNDSNWNSVQTLTTSVNLNAGNNTILFSNASAYAPDFDRITVTSAGSGYVKIVNRNSVKELAVQGASTSAGAAIVQWTDNTGANQRWQVVALGNGYVKIVNRGSNLVLDVTGASTADGIAIEQWNDNGGTNQQWQLVDVGGGYDKIVNRNSGKVLDDYAGQTNDGAPVVQWTDNGGTNQQWQIISA